MNGTRQVLRILVENISKFWKTQSPFRVVLPFDYRPNCRFSDSVDALRYLVQNKHQLAKSTSKMVLRTTNLNFSIGLIIHTTATIYCRQRSSYPFTCIHKLRSSNSPLLHTRVVCFEKSSSSTICRKVAKKIFLVS